MVKTYPWKNLKGTACFYVWNFPHESRNVGPLPEIMNAKCNGSTR